MMNHELKLSLAEKKKMSGEKARASDRNLNHPSQTRVTTMSVDL